MKIAVVIPVLNEHGTLSALAEEIRAQIGTDDRILFIDDGSNDGSWQIIKELHSTHDNIEAVRLRRNYGKTIALTVGFARADGDVVFMMDADLQDDPKEIPRFMKKLEEGYDLVSGWKERRRDPWTKTLPSRVYNAAISGLFRLGLHDVNCGFKAMRTDLAKKLPLRGDMHRLIPILAAKLGARVTEISVEHHPRRSGVSKYGFERFWRGIRDAARVFLASDEEMRRGLPDVSDCIAEELRR
jgi:dolichol-phosphate mannosyltransferase